MSESRGYQQVLAQLDSLQMHKIKLGLEAMQQFLGKVGNPEKELSFVHIAGTNGKGTVCAALNEILSRSGYRVGVYTSPHLVSVRERFVISGTCISEADFARLGSRIIAALNGDKITYFEFVTALALLWFAENNVDLVLLETGMGGRLDATNVVMPLVTVITSISMDHESWLGSSLAEIAAEKAGIIKQGVPVVSAAAEEAAGVIDEKAEACGAALFRLHQEFDYCFSGGKSWCWQGKNGFGRTIDGLVSNSVSMVQQENEALALAVLPLLENYGFCIADSSIRAGLSSLVWAGRMEQLEIVKGGKRYSFLLDGAHNPAGVANLAASLKKHFPQRRLAVWGSMADKNLEDMLHQVRGLFAALVLTMPEGERSATPDALFAALPASEKKNALCVPDICTALQQVMEKAEEGDVIVVAGSLYMVGAARLWLLAAEEAENET